MKKLFSTIMILCFLSLCFNSCVIQKETNPKWVQDPRVEVVNSQTVIFRDVVKVEIITNNPSQITYVYDIRHFKPVQASKGSFAVDLKRGDYLIQSNRKITKTQYDVIIE
jgi:hypothetical protein